MAVALGFSVAYSSAKAWQVLRSGDNLTDSPYLIRRGFINRQRVILIVHLCLNTITLLDLGNTVCASRRSGHPVEPLRNLK